MALLDTMGLKRCPGTILCDNGIGIKITGAPWLNVTAAMQIPDNCYILGHVPSRFKLERFKVITVFRDPRNVLVSYCRHRKRTEGLDVTIPQAIGDFWGAPFVDVYSSFLGWKGRSVVVRYEDLPSSVVGNGSGIYQQHSKDWNTRTGSPSKWQEVWTEEDEAAWVKIKGQDLVESAGYSSL